MAFSPLLMIGLVLVGIFTFAAFFTLSAFAPELTSGRDGRTHVLSQSAVGFAGAMRLARARGSQVEIGRVLGDRARMESLVVLTPEHPLAIEDLEATSGGSTLVVLPKWTVGPHPTHRGWVATLGPQDTSMVARIVEDVAPGLTVQRAGAPTMPELIETVTKERFASGPIDRLQTIAGPNLRPVLVDQHGRIVVGMVDPPEALSFYVLADPDFLNTQGLRNLDTAHAGMAILDATRLDGDPIIFDVTLNGFGAARSALRLAFEPPFLGATLGLCVAIGLLGWRAASRFGPGVLARRALPLGKATLADNSAALIRLAGREAKMGQGYARLIAAQIAGSIAGSRRDEAENIGRLDTLAARHNVTPPLSALVNEAANPKSTAEMLEAARKLHAWKEEMKRATR